MLPFSGVEGVTQVPSPKVVLIRLLPKNIAEFRTPGSESGYCRSSDSSSTSSSSSTSDSEVDENPEPKSKKAERDSRLTTSILNVGTTLDVDSESKMGKRPQDDQKNRELGIPAQKNGASRSRSRKRMALKRTNDGVDSDDSQESTPLKRVKRVRQRTPKVGISANLLKNFEGRKIDQDQSKLFQSVTNTSEASQRDVFNSPGSSAVSKDSNLCTYCLKHFSSATNVLRHIKLRCPIVKSQRTPQTHS